MDWDRDPTPAVDDYLAWERDDPHLWARIPQGHHRNLFEQAVDSRDQLRSGIESALRFINAADNMPIVVDVREILRAALRKETP